MPYDMKLALEQEAQSGLRPASPYRLSPRELSKASAQSNPSAAPSVSCYSVLPPGNQQHAPSLPTPSPLASLGLGIEAPALEGPTSTFLQNKV